MLELYHNINSVCAQKVRIALAEKGQKVTEHLLTLQGDQNDPAYMKLNPNGVVPTLVHDGNVIVESSLILYYIDDAFPDPPLMPKAPVARHRVRLYNKLIDEYMHNACTIMTFATAFRPRFLKMPREQWLAEINKAPLKRRAEYKRSVIEHGLEFGVRHRRARPAPENDFVDGRRSQARPLSGRRRLQPTPTAR